MKMLLLSAILTSFLTSFSPANACTPDGKEGIFPENHLWIPDSRFGVFSISETEFDAVNAKLEKIYAPVFAAQGRTLKVIANWKDGTVNAYADRSGKTSNVHMFGGLARHKDMTMDGFTLVICHETGHHLGGAPKIKSVFGSPSWASDEGEADYFSTLKCAREMWKDEDNEAIVAKMDIPAAVTEKCQKGFDKPGEIALCKRSAMGGQALGNTLANLEGTSNPDFEKPDPSVVSRTDDNHPHAQCRLDTYFAGATCSKSKDDPLSDTDPTAGVCAQEHGEVLGVRPVCWYHPGDGTTRRGGGSTWPSTH